MANYNKILSLFTIFLLFTAGLAQSGKFLRKDKAQKASTSSFVDDQSSSPESDQGIEEPEIGIEQPYIEPVDPELPHVEPVDPELPPIDPIEPVEPELPVYPVDPELPIDPEFPPIHPPIIEPELPIIEPPYYEEPIVIPPLFEGGETIELPLNDKHGDSHFEQLENFFIYHHIQDLPKDQHHFDQQLLEEQQHLEELKRREKEAQNQQNSREEILDEREVEVEEEPYNPDDVHVDDGHVDDGHHLIQLPGLLEEGVVASIRISNKALFGILQFCRENPEQDRCSHIILQDDLAGEITTFQLFDFVDITFTSIDLIHPYPEPEVLPPDVEILPEDILPGGINPEEVFPEGIHPEDILPGGINPEEVLPEEIHNEEGNSRGDLPVVEENHDGDLPLDQP